MWIVRLLLIIWFCAACTAISPRLPLIPDLWRTQDKNFYTIDPQQPLTVFTASTLKTIVITLLELLANSLALITLAKLASVARLSRTFRFVYSSLQLLAGWLALT